MQSLTRVVEAIEKVLAIEVNGRTMYIRSPNTVKIERNGPAWRQSSLQCKTHLSFIWLNICFEKKQSESYASYYIFKATFDCNYYKFYSLFGNLFQLNMKSLLQWICQHIHKIIMNSHNKTVHNGLLLLVLKLHLEKLIMYT